MSDPVLTLPKLVLPPQTAVANTVVVFDPPPSMVDLPYATVLDAVLNPPLKAGDLPILTITLPDNTTVDIPVKIPVQAQLPTDITIKIMPPEFKNSVAFKIQFNASSQLPKIEQNAAEIERYTLNTQPELIIDSKINPIKTEAFVIKSIPDKIIELLPELAPIKEKVSLQAGTKIEIELRPEQNALPILGKPQASLIPSPESPAAPMPQKAPDQTIKIIELPKDSQKSLNPIPDLTPKTNPFAVQSNIEKSPPQPTIAPTVLPDIISDKLILRPMSEISAAYGDKPEPLAPKTELPPMVTKEAELVIKTSQSDMIKVAEEILKHPTPDTKPVKPETNLANKLAPTDLPRATAFTPKTQIEGLIYKPTDASPALIATKIGVIAPTEQITLPHLMPVMIKINAVSIPVESFPLPDISDPAPFKNTWTVLTHALQSVEKSNPQAFLEMKAILPQVSPKLPALMLSFVTAATKNIPFTTWLGEANVAALRQTENGERVLKRLEKDFSSTPKKAIDKQGNTWKGYDIPFLTGAVVEPVSLYLQKPPEEYQFSKSGAKNTTAGVRFVLDLSLTKLGKVQLEGLASRPIRTFNLTIRHLDNLPPDFETNIKLIFTRTLDALSYTGTVLVRKTDQFVTFQPEETKKSGVWA